jgi:hypothetical protein
MVEKSKYKVTINWYGENHSFYTSTRTKQNALQNAMSQLSRKLFVSLVSVQNKVNYGSNNYKILKVKEKKND